MKFPLGRIIDCEGRLQREFIEFARLWSAVKEDWRDDQCRRFEQTHLSSMGPSMNRFVGSLHQFCDEIRKAEKELQDSRQSLDELS